MTRAAAKDAALARLPVGDHFVDPAMPGLMLRKRDARAGTWLLRVYEHGRRRVVSLGPWPDMDHRAACDTARRVRDVASRGGDWRAAVKDGRMGRRARTFGWCLNRLEASMRAGWSQRHAQNWRSTMDRYAMPVLGDMDVADIRREDVLQVLQPIWTRLPQTAARLRQRIEAVIDYARALGLAPGDNPARWKGGLKSLLPATARVRAVRHHPAVDHRHAPAVFAALWSMAWATEEHAAAASAVAFAMLTATRSGEVRGMTLAEVDMERRVWVIPAARMKARKEHRVPLSEPATMLLLPMARQHWTSAKITPGAMVSVLRAALGKLDLPKTATVHGLRSTFRDWAGEETRHGREIIEHALAHKLQDAVEAAYARGDLLEKRAALMSDWGAYIGSQIAATIGADGVTNHGQQTGDHRE